jgi:purine-nucleoside phosphorylase
MNEKPCVLISRCLLGVPCRYHGRPVNVHGVVARLERKYTLVDVCPECDAGMSIPRPPSRWVDDQVICGGRDVTGIFLAGAEIAVAKAASSGATRAYLVKGSPSCDPKHGMTGCLLLDNGVRVIGV